MDQFVADAQAYLTINGRRERMQLALMTYATAATQERVRLKEALMDYGRDIYFFFDDDLTFPTPAAAQDARNQAIDVLVTAIIESLPSSLTQRMDTVLDGITVRLVEVIVYTTPELLDQLLED
jgi:hypothetical protein